MRARTLTTGSGASALRPGRWSPLLDRRAVFRVHQRGTRGHGGQRLGEALLLPIAALVQQISGVKMREHTFRLCALEQRALLGDTVPRQAGARHARVDLQMPRPAGAGPGLDHGRIAERRGEVGAAERVDLGAKDRREDDDRPGDAGAPELGALGDRRHPEAPRLERFERQRRPDGAEAVGVGLHHREHGHAGARRDGSPVAAQRAQVDLDPGACHGTARFAIM
jgi:hypothetical protein